MANKINATIIDDRFMNYCAWYLVKRNDIKTTESGTIERKDATRALNECMFNILATDDEKLAIGRKNCARKAGKAPMVGTAKTIPDAFKAALSGDSSALEKALISYLPTIGVGNVNTHSVQRFVRDIIAFTNGVRVNKEGELTASGARTIDKSLINAMIHVLFARDEKRFAVDYKAGTITRVGR